MNWQRIIMGIIGAALLVGAGYFTYHQYQFQKSALVTKGRVTAQAEHSGSKGRTMYAPKVSFKAADGNTYEFTSKLSSSSPSYGVGETVEVQYDPADPKNAEVKSFLAAWLVSIVFLIMGGFMFFFSVFGGKFYQKKNIGTPKAMTDNNQAQ